MNEERTRVWGCTAAHVAGWVISSMCALGCDVSNPSQDPLRRQLLESWGQDVLLPWYEQFEAATGDLDQAATDFCEAPSEAALGDVQQAWWDTRAPFKRADVFAFGPYMDFALQLGAKIDFWPARPATVDGLLEGSDALTAAVVAGMGAPAKGLPAIEYVLYAPEDAVLSAYEASARRCDYLLAATQVLRDDATSLREAWDPEAGNYLGQLTLQKEPSEFASLQAALSEVVGEIASLLELIQADKLGAPLGADVGTPQPDLAESRFSDRSLQDIADNLSGIETLYYGADVEEAIGLDVLLADRERSDLDLVFRQRLDAARLALGRIPEPFSEAIVVDAFTITESIDALRDLQAFFQVDVANALSLSLALFDNDGD